MEGHAIGVVKPGTAQKAALNAVFVYIYQVMYVYESVNMPSQK
jgi:hypothetical protein